jgi:membrane protein CcdC involved in cytochrome C biogenesis
MDMQSSMLGRRRVLSQPIVMMIMGILEIRAVMIVMIISDCIQCDRMEGMLSMTMMPMSMRRSSRDEAIAGKGKRQEKTHEASSERHDSERQRKHCRSEEL